MVSTCKSTMYNEDVLSGPYGTSPLYTSIRSLRNLHSLRPSALGCVNSVETCTSVYNLHVYLHVHVCVYSLDGNTVYVCSSCGLFSFTLY